MRLLHQIWPSSPRLSATGWMIMPRNGAALAFYSVLSLAPLLLLALALAGLFFDQADARQQLSEQMTEVIGKEGAEAIREMIDSGTKAGSKAATAFGIVMLLFAASGVFGELQTDLNAVWDVKPKPFGIFGFLKSRFFSFAMVLGSGFLLVVSLLMSTAIAVLHASARGALPQFEILWHGLSSVVTFALVTLLFALIYKLLPDAEVAWRDVWWPVAHRGPIHRWQIRDWPVLGQKRTSFGLRRGGIARRLDRMGLLLRPDLVSWCGDNTRNCHWPTSSIGTRPRALREGG